MEEVATLCVRVQCKTLLAVDLVSVLKSIERAYNWTDSFLRRRGRVHPSDRLRLRSIEQLKDTTLFLTGYSAAIVTLGYLIHVVSNQEHPAGKIQKTNWKLQSAEAKFHQENQETQDRIQRALAEEDPNLMRVVNSIKDLDRHLRLASRIAAIEIGFAVNEPETTPERI